MLSPWDSSINVAYKKQPIQQTYLSNAMERIHFGYAQSPSDTLDLSLKSVQTSLAMEVMRNSPQQYSLLSPEQPLLMIHGTSADGTALEKLQECHTAHPVYRSFIPEIKESTGINMVKKKRGLPNYPAYVMVLRDLGDFRIQLAYKKTGQLDKLGHRPNNEQLCRFFNISKENQWLLPIIRSHLLEPIQTTPRSLKIEFREDKTLPELLGEAMANIYTEAFKVATLTELPDIIDTSFLAQKAEKAKKPLNTIIGKRSDKAVHLRPVSLDDIARIETYWLAIEEGLVNAIKPALKQHYQDTKQDRFANNDIILEDHARQTAEFLLDTLHPKGLGLGHSQGGIALHTALMHSILEAPATLEDLQKANHTPPKSPFSEVPFDNKNDGYIQPEIPAALLETGRMVGLTDYRSSPFQGLFRIPAWVESIMKTSDVKTQMLIDYARQHGIPLKKDDQAILNAMRQNLWEYFGNRYPSLIEMKPQHPLTRNFATTLDQASNDQTFSGGVTFMNSFNKTDLFIEPDFSPLKSDKEKQPRNVFNIGLNGLPKEPPKTVQEFLDGHERVFPRIFPRKWQETICAAFDAPPSQHRATLNFPKEMTEGLGLFFLTSPDAFIQSLDPPNYRAFQTQLLKDFSQILYPPHRTRLPQEPIIEGLFQARQWTTCVQALLKLKEHTAPLDTALALYTERTMSGIVTLFSEQLKRREYRSAYKNDMLSALQLIASTPGGHQDAAQRLLRRYMPFSYFWQNYIAKQ